MLVSRQPAWSFWEQKRLFDWLESWPKSHWPRGVQLARCAAVIVGKSMHTALQWMVS
jgi:hypothetical protein